MARFGKLPVIFPESVTPKIIKDEVMISGPKGQLTKFIPRGISVAQKDNQLLVQRNGESKQSKSDQGSLRSHLINMIKGVSEGWSKQLEISGAGLRAEIRGDELVLNIGFSHPVIVKAPKDIKFAIDKSIIKIEGINKETVGEIAAKIRMFKKPEPYKGSGIKYVGEIIRRKAGKQATTSA